jgi:hypothetical protein
MDLKLEEKIRHECTVERVDASRSDPLAYTYGTTTLSMLSLITIPDNHVTTVCQFRLFRLSSTPESSPPSALPSAPVGRDRNNPKPF